MGVVGVNAGLNPEQPGLEEDAQIETKEVIWFDAHADLESADTTASGYLDGMDGSMMLG